MLIKCVSISERIVCVWLHVGLYVNTCTRLVMCVYVAIAYMHVCGNVCSGVFMWLWGGTCVRDPRCGVYVCMYVNTGCVAGRTCVHVCLPCAYAGASAFGVHVCAEYTNRYGHA